MHEDQYGNTGHHQLPDYSSPAATAVTTTAIRRLLINSGSLSLAGDGGGAFFALAETRTGRVNVTVREGVKILVEVLADSMFVSNF